MFSKVNQRLVWLVALMALSLGLFGTTLQLLAAVAPPPPAGDEFPRTISLSRTYELKPLGSYQTGLFDAAAAEIVAFDPLSQTLYVVNGISNTVDVLDASDPHHLTLLRQINMTPYGTGLNSLDFYDGVLAVAVEVQIPLTTTENYHGRGYVTFFDRQDNLLANVMVGYLPDMLTFTPDGSKVLVANEGEPAYDYSFDPEGSVSVIDLSGGVEIVTQTDVVEIGFTDFNEGGPRHEELDPEIRIFGPTSTLTVANNLEPEYIAVSEDSMMAWVTLQENNALAILDLSDNSLVSLVALGTKDHSLVGNELDASDRDNGINIITHPVRGFYMPDAIASYTVSGTTYLVTANEGDARDYDAYGEEARVSSLTLDPTAFPTPTLVQTNTVLGRLNVTTANGDTDDDGDFDVLYSFGARSFTIWSATGEVVFDSGSQLEQLIAIYDPAYFNSDNSDNDSFDSRSDNKGPEPEAIAVGEVDGRMYAFVGLERVGGIVMYDITDPENPVLVTFINNRNFAVDAESSEAGDLGPEGITFIPAADSPTGQPMLAVANEISGSTTLFAIQRPRVYLPLVETAP